MSKKNKKNQVPTIKGITTQEPKTENKAVHDVVSVEASKSEKLEVLVTLILGEARLLLHQETSSINDLINFTKQYEELLDKNEEK